MSTGIQHHIAPEVLGTYRLTGDIQISKACVLTCDCGKSGCGTLYRAESVREHPDLWLGTKCVVQLDIRFDADHRLATGVRLSDVSYGRNIKLITQLKYAARHVELAKEQAERRAANALKAEQSRLQRAALEAEAEAEAARKAEARRVARASLPSIAKLPGPLLPG